MRNNKNKLQKLAVTALLAALATALGYLDAILPILDFIPLPGVKLGLANFAVLLSLYLFGTPVAAVVSLVRILLVDLLLFPSVTSLLYALCGGALSLAVMVLLKKCAFHPISVSIGGAVTHNLGQTLIAMLVLSTPGLFSYFALLFPIGIASGALLGFLTALIHPRIKNACIPMT